jgi:DNA-binding CsgD family transcriptional regulator
VISLPIPDVQPALPTCALVAEPRLLCDLIAQWLSVRCRVRLVSRSGLSADARAAIDRHRPELLIVATTDDTSALLDTLRHFVTVCPAGRVLAIVASNDTFVVPPCLGERLVVSCAAATPLGDLAAALDALVAPTAGTGSPMRADHVRGTPLSAQESRILDLIAGGLTSRAISASLGISEHTVRAHRKRITAKLGLAGTRLVHRAVMLRRAAQPGDRDDV